MGMYIYAAGGFAREVAWLAETVEAECAGQKVLGFVDDSKDRVGQVINGYKVFSFEEVLLREEKPQFSVAIGSPSARQKVSERILSHGGELVTLIHPRVERSRWLDVGAGTVICAGSILTTNIKLGVGVQINLDCTVGHDVLMDDYATLAPGAHISGFVHLGKRVYVGTGAVIINGNADQPLIIGDDAVIGAGAVVSKSLQGGMTYVGIPARPLAPK